MEADPSRLQYLLGCGSQVCVEEALPAEPVEAVDQGRLEDRNWCLRLAAGFLIREDIVQVEKIDRMVEGIAFRETNAVFDFVLRDRKTDSAEIQVFEGRIGGFEELGDPVAIAGTDSIRD